MRAGRWGAKALGMAVAALAAASCGLLPDMDDFATGAPSTTGSPDGGGDDLDAGGAGPDADAAPLPTCIDGSIGGIRAFELIAPDASATTCGGVENALVVDGRVVGLDAIGYTGTGKIGGKDEHACVGVQFVDEVHVAYVSLLTSGRACASVPPCDGQCGQDDYGDLFASTDGGSYTYIQAVYGTSVVTEKEVPIFVPGAHVLLFCRSGTSRDKDDPSVDALRAACP